MVKPISWLRLRDMRNPVTPNLVSLKYPDSSVRFICACMLCFPASRYRQHLFSYISSLIAGCNSHTYQMPL